MAVNEIVRVQVVVDGADAAVQKVELTEEGVLALVESFGLLRTSSKESLDTVSESVDEVAARLQGQLNSALEGTTITLGQVRQAQLDLNKALLAATSSKQIRDLAAISRRYDGLEQEIIEAAEAQDVFTTRLGGFGASGSAGAASLIQLTRGIEDLRFGAAFAINNIEPFLTSLNRLEKIANATGVSVRDQLVGAILSPAGALFAFQTLLTAAVILQPVLDTLFDNGTDDAERFADAVDEVLSSLIEIEREEVRFRISADEEDLRSDLQEVQDAIDETRRTLSTTLAETRIDASLGRAVVVANNLTTEQREAREELEGSLLVLEKLEAQLEEQLAVTRALAAARGVANETLEGQLIDDEVRAQEEELLDFIDELIAEEEDKERQLSQLRKRLQRELNQTRLDNIEDEEEKAIQAAQNEFAERIRLAQRAGDQGAEAEFREALEVRLNQIRADFAQRRAEAEEKRLNDIARKEKALLRELNQLRASSEENALQRSLDIEEERFRRAQQLAVEANDPEAAAELERLLQERRLQVFLEFLQKRANEEQKQLDRTAREATKVANELQREFQNRIREVQEFTDAIIFTIRDAARSTEQTGDAEAALVRRQFEQEEEELRDARARRLIDERDFSLELAALSERRANFDKQIEEERASFIERSARGLLDQLIEIGLQELSAFIARQAAALLFAQSAQQAAAAQNAATMAQIAAQSAPAAAAVSIATFGGAAAAGAAAATAAILQVTALTRGLQSGFADGGYTGSRDKNAIAGVVHGGEWVFPKSVVDGNIQAFRHLDWMLRNGMDMSDLLHMIGVPGFQVGGLVPLGSQIEPVFNSSGSDNSILGRTRAEVQMLNDRFASMESILFDIASRPIDLNIDDRGSRKLQQGANVQRKQVIPRRFRT